MEPIAEPFTSRAQRVVFVAAVLGLLLLPFVLVRRSRPTLRERLRSVPTAGGDFAWVEHTVLDEPDDIDVLVLGTSYLWAAIDTPFLEEAAGGRLGRPAVARTIGTNFRGEEMYFALLREVLSRKHIGVLVLSMPGVRDRREGPHPYSHRVAGPDFLSLYDGLPLEQRGAAAGDLLLSATRHALPFVRPERSEKSPLVASKGALLRQAGFDGAPFHEQHDEEPRLSEQDLTWAPSNPHFCFSNDPLNDAQLQFSRKTIELAQAHGISVVVIHVPTWVDHIDGAASQAEAWPDCVEERMRYPEVFPGIKLVGASPRTLFGGMTEKRAQGLFYSGHMNANGARYFTATLLPAILEAVH